VTIQPFKIKLRTNIDYDGIQRALIWSGNTAKSDDMAKSDDEVVAARDSSTPPSVPAALRPWQDVFATMAPEHLRILGQLVTDLRALIDEPQWTAPQPRGEFDHYDGITNRGDMERLLASEWIWRDLDDQEFLRRFAERELLYHHVRQRTPTETACIAVILDSGPWMLGRPRLVALAALICIGRIALRDNLRLLWRSNSTASASWNEGFGFDAIQRLLTEVSATSLSNEEVEHHLADLTKAATGAALMRCYVIGPRHSPAAAAQATRIAITEKPRLDGEGNPVFDAEVALETMLGHKRRIRLPLPPDKEAAALLRHPFLVPKPAKAVSPDSAVFDQNWALRHVAAFDSGNILLLDQPGGILVIHHDQNFFLPIRQHETLLGIHVDSDGLTTARLLRYLGFSRLIVEQYARFKTTILLFELRLKNDAPLLQSRPAPHTIPLMGQPGRRSRFWIYAPDGRPYEISRDGVRPCAMLNRLTIVKSMSGYIIVRNRAGSLSVRSLEASYSKPGRSRPAGQALATFDIGLRSDTRLDAEDVLFNPAHMLLAVRTGRIWRSYGWAFNPIPSSFSVAEDDRLLDIHHCEENSHGRNIFWSGLQGGRFYLTRWDNEERYFPGLVGHLDFRTDLVVHSRACELHAEDGAESEAAASPVLVELDADGFPGRLLDGDFGLIDVAQSLARAQCLRP